MSDEHTPFSDGPANRGGALLFVGEKAARADGALPPEAAAPWRILVVDDDPEVHAVTRLALSKVRFKNRPLLLHSAYSAAEAAAVLRSDGDIAMILLDVVMETEDAGIRLVRTIRDEIGNRAVRIVLRTGQPGQAPEESIIVDCDINDYKAKTELTTQKLFTTVIAALRAYADITALETNRRGLQRITESTDRLFQLRARGTFTQGVLVEFAGVLGVATNGLLCTQRGPAFRPGPQGWTVLAAAGRFAVLRPPGCEGNEAAAVAEAFRTRRPVYAEGFAAFYVPVPGGEEIVVGLGLDRPLDAIDRGLAEVFATKIGLGFGNVSLYERLREANETLEARVAERTRELEEANAKLERLATLDVLTEVWNRRHFMDLAAAEVSRTRRYKRCLSLVLLDLDHFKAVNDSYGHAAGDAALRAVVARMREALRGSDLIARFGGEEFVVLLPETDAVGAAVLAERVREGIAAEPLVFGTRRFAVTASIGVADWLPEDGNVERTLMRADAALYEAKVAGRNRVVVAVAPAAGRAAEDGADH